MVIGALTGSKEHAVKHAEAGVDVRSYQVLKQEAIAEKFNDGGRTEVLQAIKDYDHIAPAAWRYSDRRTDGGLYGYGSVRVWCGSVWLTTSEAETTPTVKEKMIQATPRDTVRSRVEPKAHPTTTIILTNAWYQEGAPEPLPCPCDLLVARTRKGRPFSGIPSRSKQLATIIGQAVGLMTEQSVKNIVYDFMKDHASGAPAESHSD